MFGLYMLGFDGRLDKPLPNMMDELDKPWPLTEAFSIFNALFPDLFPIHVVDEPSWEMPEK